MIRVFGVMANIVLCVFNIYFCVENGIDYTRASAIAVTAFAAGYLMAAEPR
jgi:hypothetical protein